MRRKLIAGNWKLNPSNYKDAQNLAEGIRDLLSNLNQTEICLCVPNLYLIPLKSFLEGTPIALGAQNAYFEEKGAFTGEISPLMLKDAGIDFVILGHSERRSLFAEDDHLISRKVIAALKNLIKPIVCVGETGLERSMGQADQVILKQLSFSLSGVPARDGNIVIAYEPVWAIGTGQTCSSDEAERVCKMIRNYLKGAYGDSTADLTQILYGGSVKASNAEELLSKENIDGALVGGASLAVDEFHTIIKKAESIADHLPKLN
ncbi:MAG: triose-phosphate isomerase [Candidatus Caenarcaniphilales bacterium]|nr:triose-phosphate isomerase [Candidatus Caenarcaniphilales bacterium]